MALPDEDRQALRTRLAPGGDDAADAVADAVADDEELREIVVDSQGDVVAFTDQRALYVARGAHEVVPVGYADVEVRRRDTGLAIDALIEGGRLFLDVARGTFVRLAVVGAGGPPGRATWLPPRAPKPAPVPPPVSHEPTVASAAPPAPPGGASYGGEPPRVPPPVAATFPPVPPVQADEPSAPLVPAPPITPEPVAHPVQPPTQQGAPVPPMPPPGLPPAGWNPDPSGRHWWRWWDGMSWTDHVADGGASFVDPLPPR